MNTNEELMGVLSASETFQNYERAYVEAVGMPLAIRKTDERQVPFRGRLKESPFCALMANTSSTCAGCLRLQEELSRAATHHAAILNCVYGLCEVAVPLKQGGRTIGFLQTGQVLREGPTEDSFRGAVARARRLGVDLEIEKVKSAYFQTPVVSQRKLDSALQLLGIFGEQLAQKIHQTI